MERYQFCGVREQQRPQREVSFLPRRGTEILRVCLLWKWRSCFVCVYSHHHPDERKKFLAQKGMCFNCTGTKHYAAICRSRTRCRKCGKMHHTSICAQGDQLLTATATGNKERVVYPIVKVNVEGVMCRALLDTGAGSSYASAVLLDKIPKRTHTREVRRIKMMLGSTTRQVELSSITVRAVDGSTEIKVDVTKVDRKELLMLDNPNYQMVLAVTKFAILRLKQLVKYLLGQ